MKNKTFSSASPWIAEGIAGPVCAVLERSGVVFAMPGIVHKRERGCNISEMVHRS
jgi:hypothetical protein